MFLHSHLEKKTSQKCKVKIYLNVRTLWEFTMLKPSVCSSNQNLWITQAKFELYVQPHFVIINPPCKCSLPISRQHDLLKGGSVTTP